MNEIQPVETAPALSTGRRIWLVTAIVLSILILVLSVAGIAGAWFGRSVAIDVVTEVMTGIDQLASTGREGIVEVDALVVDVREVVGTVQEVSDQASQNVAERGVLLNLLPEEKARELESLADQIGATLDSILSIVDGVTTVLDGVRSLPFVDVPSPEEVGSVRQEVEAIIASIDGLVADIAQFRQEAAAEIARVTQAAERVGGRLDTASQSLAELDQELVAIQLKANNIKERFPLWATIATLIVTLFSLWVSYGMVQLVRGYWLELRAPKPAPAGATNLVTEKPQARPLAQLPDAPAEKLSEETPDVMADAGAEEPPHETLGEEEE